MWHSRSIILSLLLLLLLSHLSMGRPGAQVSAPGGQRSPIVIKADTLEIDDERKVVTFSGNVDAQESQFTMTCDKMLVFYREQKGAAGSEENQLRIEKILARGNVVIIRKSGGRATAEEALYYHDTEKLVLTGRPVVRQGKDFVEGSKITLLLRENRSIVEGSGDNKVRAVLFPSKKEGKSVER